MPPLDRTRTNSTILVALASVARPFYYGLRGSNTLLNCRILVLLGCPIPNVEGFKEECQAFFYDDEGDLKFDWTGRQMALDLRGGGQYPVIVDGYWEPPVADLYEQKSQAELYQALHRLRPYEEREYERHIFVFTNMPIPDVKVDELLGRTAEFQWTVARKVKELLLDQPECTVPELAAAGAGGAQGRTLTRRIGDGSNPQMIAALAGAVFERGRGKRPSRYARHA